ncbi:flagellar hook protein FlgE [Desulfohalotomaculum tongense]|uniref:flagellar hook-basal body protein n=1 Tax=Desulforadius tongensis TaxID=1216062 RepID=UPI001956E3CE|nr:flagellar hook-basal body complex protein [Desulforadius tongensis]MBM7854217.1 flagellar hook protein FlgE [Desulforadius tongensis]
MLRSLYSGIAGLGTHRTKMDVIGNNIANVNTTGFKSSRTNFQDVLYQKIKSGGNSRNAAFIGTGVDVAGISTDFGQGATQNTGRTLDLAINGNGFFVVSDADLVDASGAIKTFTNDGTGVDGIKGKYTRDGIMFIDKDGYIVNSNGLKLIGRIDDGNGSSDPKDDQYGAIRILLTDHNGDKLTVESINIGPDGTITGTYTNGDRIQFDDGSGTYRDPSGAGPFKNSVQIAIASFGNNEGLDKIGSNLYAEAKDVSGKAVYSTAADMESVSVASGYLEMSNVDLSNEFVNMITTQRGFQANARTITVSDQMLEELVNLKR